MTDSWVDEPLDQDSAADVHPAGPASPFSSPAPSPGFSSPKTLAMVETAFLASASSLIWLINYYFPAGPLLRVFFPVPIALVYLRWGYRPAWMSVWVSGLLLSVLMGPPRSLLFLMPYALLGVQLGAMWGRQVRWAWSISVGTLLATLGFFFRIWILSAMLGEDLWVYLTTQITQMLEWAVDKLVNWGIAGSFLVGQPSLWLVQACVFLSIIVSSLVYLFVVHLVAWLLLERMGKTIPPPPEWVQVLLDV